MTIYFDLDGVLVNFVKQCTEKKCFKTNGKVNWDKVDSLGKEFWTEMEWMPGSKELYKKLEVFANSVGWKIKILSAIHSDSGKEGKIEWCEKNLGISRSNIDIVKKKEYKLARANPLSILIDDKEELVNSFTYAGGTGILYDTAELTSQRLGFFMDAIMELEASGNPDDINNPVKLLEVRLRNAFIRCDPQNWKPQYKDVLYYIHHVLLNHPSLRDIVFTENNNHHLLNEKFNSIKSLYFYFEEKYAELSDDKYPYTDWINNNLNVALSRFYNKTFDYELLNLIQKENVFDKILKQMGKTHKLIILPLYSRWDIYSLLSFSYYTSLINYLQEQILRNQKD